MSTSDLINLGLLLCAAIAAFVAIVSANRAKRDAGKAQHAADQALAAQASAATSLKDIADAVKPPPDPWTLTQVANDHWIFRNDMQYIANAAHLADVNGVEMDGLVPKLPGDQDVEPGGTLDFSVPNRSATVQVYWWDAKAKRQLSFPGHIKTW